MLENIKKALTGAGISLFGYCAFSQLKENLLSCRAAERLPENAQTVLVCLFPYKVDVAPPENLSRYAALPDYHTVCGSMLQAAAGELAKQLPEYSFIPFIDNSPIPEVQAAVLCGLGIRGKNNLLLTKQYGSFCFIGEIVTNLALPAQPVLQGVWEEEAQQTCLSCNLCLKACPTGRLTNFESPCFSEITQQKQPLTGLQKALIKRVGTVWGCDVCQTACPLNQKAAKTNIAAFLKGYRNKYEREENGEGRAYNWRGPKIIKRNVAVLEDLGR